MEAAESNFDKLLAARQCLRDTLEISNSFASQCNETTSRLTKINQNLPLLSTELHSTYTRKSTLSAVRAHVDRAFGPVAAVLKIYDLVRGLEKSLMVGPIGGDIVGYLSLIKQLEEGLRFLSDNCGLAVRWMEDILELLDENEVADDKYILNVQRSLRILKDLKALETRAWLNGGLLSDSLNKLELEFRQLVKENCGSSKFSETTTRKLHAIIERLKANNRLENCKTIYADVRSSTARAAIQALGLSYLEVEISDSDSVQKVEDHILQWSKHMEFALKHVLHAELELCKGVFDKFGPDVSLYCFAKITTHSGFLELLKFGSKVTEAKKDAIKLLKLLDMFAVLDRLRLDFNKLFGSKPCLKIQNLTRDLVKRVIDGACEIFKELQLQVEAQRYNMIPPSLDGGVPRLVTFVTSYCIMLLEDDYRLILSQVLSIHRTWNGDKSGDGILRKEFHKIVEALEVNLETWAKAFEDTALSYFFLMNNYNYMHGFLQDTVFSDLMGENWLREHEQKMENHAQGYLKESWAKLPAILSEEDLILFSPRRTSTEELVKKRLREFNESFEDMYKKQCEWVVSDDGLREMACLLIVHTVVPTYRSYLHNYGYLVGKGSSPGKYVKYSAASLEAMLSSLFHPKMAKLGRSNSTKTNHLVGKLRSAVTNQFRIAPITT